jgi:tetratricopeptide (TPR) repeat protein
MTWVILIASAVLAGVAVAGVLRPFGGPRQETLEKLADPMEDERLSLLRSLKDLDDEKAVGALGEDDYRALRTETEARAISVLRAIEARDGAGRLAPELRAIRSKAAGNGKRSPEPRPSRRRTILAILAGGLVVAVAVPLLLSALKPRSAGAPITGGIPTGSDPSGLAFFEQRVADHPQDVAARLDLAQRYFEAGDVKDAVNQYLEALKLDPKSAEAHAYLGYVLYLAGKADEGLQNVDQALQVDPTYPEALYFEGLILLKGLNRPTDAATAFQAYLDAAPFGSRREEVEQLLKEAQTQPSG